MSIYYPGMGDIKVDPTATEHSNSFTIPEEYSTNQFPFDAVPVLFNLNSYVNNGVSYRRTKREKRDFPYNDIKSTATDVVSATSGNDYDYGPYGDESSYKEGESKLNTTGGDMVEGSGFHYAQLYADSNVTWDVDGVSKNINGSDIMKKLRKTVGIRDNERDIKFRSNFYNRFKMPLTDTALQRGQSHVFFIRPTCNLLEDGGDKLLSQAERDPEITFIWKEHPDIIRQLTNANGMPHDWMFLLSNHVNSFSLNDDYIKTETYGKTYTGYGISYGRHNIESKGAGDFSIEYNDDRFLSIYKLHKVWVDYIAKLYRGIYVTNPYMIWNKILDYASAVYYIVTAEDGETILFWTKYYGVFPSETPSSQYSLSSGSTFDNSNTNLTIKYNYSFKEDLDPIALIEMNANSKYYMSPSALLYIPTYDANLLGTGETWVGAPFVEFLTDSDSGELVPKLRFADNSGLDIYKKKTTETSNSNVTTNPTTAREGK